MKTFFSVFQILISIVLIVLVVLQSKGSGLGRNFLSSGSNYSTKRGFEKVIFNATIITASLFFVSSVIQLIF